MRWRGWTRRAECHTAVGGDPAVEQSDSDRDLLVALYNNAGGASWSANANWLSAKPLGEWHGVTTNSDGRVTELALPDNQLTGEILPELGALPNLTWLALQGNPLTGCIPEGWRDVARNDLEALSLPDCGAATP